MEKFSCNSYPDSAGSSPRSREIDFENPSPWDEQQSYKAKFMCSYGGKIQPRPHDNQLAYVGGETKILAVDRGIKFSDMIAKLSALCTGGGDSGVSFKYQLPGEDLDALISVTNDDDLEHMMHEYDRISRGSGKPVRMRLFLFPASSPAGGLGSDSSVRSEQDRFVEALNSGPARAETEKPVAAAQGNVDFLFGLEKAIPPPQSPPPPPPQVHSVPPHAVVGVDERDIRSDHGLNPAEIQRQLHELQRLQIMDQEQRHQRAFNQMEAAGGFYQKFQDNRPPASGQQAPPVTAGYWPEKHVSGGGAFPATTPGFPDQQMYVLPSGPPGTFYHAPPQATARPVTGQPGQGYYNVQQRMPPDVYRDQLVYNNAVNPTAQGMPTMEPAPPPPFSAAQPAFSAGPPQSAQPVRHMADPVFRHVGYDAGSGRPVYYTSPGGGVMAPPPGQAYPGVGVPVSGGSGGGGGGAGQEGKVMPKIGT